MEKKKELSLSGGSKIKTIDEFSRLANSEFTVKSKALVDEFKERKNYLELCRDRQISEYGFMMNIININTMQQNGTVAPAAIFQAEKEISALTYESVAASYSLDYWRIQWGENMILPVICDIVNYFLKQFEVKEKLDDTEIMQLSIKLLGTQPRLRVMELVFVLSKAINGDFGPTYQRIGIDTVMGWLTKFYEQSAAHLELKMVNNKPEGSRGSAPWVEMENKMKAYEREQREKQEVSDRIRKDSERKREIEKHIEKLNTE